MNCVLSCSYMFKLIDYQCVCAHFAYQFGKYTIKNRCQRRQEV